MKMSLLLSFFLCTVLFAQVPETISYQGILTDQNGIIVPDNSYAITFKLYEELSGGTAIWEEMQVVPVSKGLFNVILGEVTPLGFLFIKPYYLGITISGGGELIPRMPLTTSAYSMTSISVIDNSISTAKIQDGAITQSKLSGGLSIPPGGTAGGDLSGTYPNPAVGKIQGRTISSTAPTSGQVLSWSGTQWEPSTPSSGMGGSGTAGLIPIFASANTLSNSNLTVSSNKLGINNPAPTYTLDIGQPTESSNYIRVYSSGYGGIMFGNAAYGFNGTMIYSNNEGYLMFALRNSGTYTEKMRITKEGKLGIGTNSPLGTIHSKSSARYAGYFESDSISGNTEVIRANYTASGNYDGKGVIAYSVPANGYGYGGYFYGGYRGVYGGAEGGGYTGTSYGLSGHAYGTAGTRYGVYGGTAGGTTRYGVYASGDLAYTGSLINASDLKFKQNVSGLTNALDKVKLLEPKTFSYSSDTRYAHMNLPQGTHYGLIAQELEKVFPEMVVDAVHPSAEESRGERGGESVNYKGVTLMELIPVLIQAVKEQQQEIEELKNEIARLKK